MVTGTESLPGLLAGALSRDGARPFVTFYDDATGERVELSVATFDNWVAKTANLLVDDLLVEPGAQVALDLPTHWQTAVWLCAAWTASAVPVVGAAGATSADVHVCGPDLPEPLPRGADVVALSLRPLGGRFATPLPSGVLDYAAEVAAHGDRFVPRSPAATGDATALVVGGTAVGTDALLAEARELAEAWGLGTGGRLLSRLDPGTVEGVVATVVAALVTDGSVVLERHADESRTAARSEAERVSATAR